MMRSRLRYALIVAGAGLSACGPAREPAEVVARKAARAESLTPADARLAEMYGRSCRACHVSPAARAPLTGDKDAWDSRFAQGLGILVVHARGGFKNMPPHGQCPDCTDEDLKQLALFMAGRAR